MTSRTDALLLSMQIGIWISFGIILACAATFLILGYYRDNQVYGMLSLLLSFQVHHIRTEFESVRDFLRTMNVQSPVAFSAL